MKTKLIIFALLAILGLAVIGCAPNSIERDQYDVDAQQRHYQRYQPLPGYDWSLERAVSIQLYNLRNSARDTWSFAVSLNGSIIYGCPSKAFPLPYDVQLTNPLRYYTAGAVVEQAEPNGLYSSKNTRATWVLCQRKAGPSPFYSEPDVVSFAWPVKEVNGRLVDADDTGFTPIIIDMKQPDGIKKFDPRDYPSNGTNK